MNPFPSLKERVVLITGGSRGLGKEMAVALLDAGAHIAITGAAPSRELDEMAAMDRARMLALVADVRDADACVRAVDETIQRFGALHVLVNNAGRGMRLVSETFNTTPTRFWETDPAAWRAIMATNVDGAFHMARAAAPHFIAQKFGKIINISTSDQTMVRRGYSPYGPSKAALEAASRAWAEELRGTGVDVNVYLPGGAADTDLLPPSQEKKGADGQLLPAAVMRRAIGWLCADESNGHTAERYIARLWDETLPPDEAAAGARSAHAAKPMIM